MKPAVVAQALVPNGTRFSRQPTSAQLVGRTPWSAVDPLVDPLAFYKRLISSARAAGRGRRGAPWAGTRGSAPPIMPSPTPAKNKRHWALLRAASGLVSTPVCSSGAGSKSNERSSAGRRGKLKHAPSMHPILVGHALAQCHLLCPSHPVCINCGADNLVRAPLWGRLSGGLFGAWASLSVRKEPADSRLQPGLAAPRFVQNSSRTQSKWHWTEVCPNSSGPRISRSLSAK
jgi:hypothetical protein